MRIFVLGLVCFATACFGRGGADIESKDLAALSRGDSSQVSSAEWALDAAGAGVARSRQEQARAAVLLAGAQAENLSTTAEIDAAQAELRAGESRGDAKRVRDARFALAAAFDAQRRSEALVTWRQKAVDAAEAGTRRAEAMEGVREAELQLAQVKALGDRGVTRYDVEDFTEILAERRGELQRASRRARQANAEAEQAHQDFIRTGEKPPAGAS